MGHKMEIEISPEEFVLLQDEARLEGRTVEEQAAWQVVMATRRHDLRRSIYGTRTPKAEVEPSVSEDAEKYGAVKAIAANQPGDDDPDSEENIQRVMKECGVTRQYVLDNPFFKLIGFHKGTIIDPEKTEDDYFGQDTYDDLLKRANS